MNFIHAHSIWFLLLFAAVFIYIWLLMVEKRLRIKQYVIPFIAIAFVVYAVLCAKLFSAAENGSSGGMSLYGGLFGMPIAFFIGAKISKRPVAVVFDIFTIPTLLTVLMARINCLVAGCCLGIYIPGSDIRWPVREIEIVFYIIQIIYIGNSVYKRKMNGRAYPFYMFTYSALRFILEFVRESDQTGTFHRAHLWAIIAIAIGLFLYFWLKTHPPLVRKKRRK